MTKIGFTPYSGYILVKEIEDDSEITTANAEGIISNNGIVVAVGDNYLHTSGKYRDAGVKVGDKIVFRATGDKVSIDGEKYLIVPFDNIRGVMG